MHSSAICFCLSLVMRFICVDTYIKNCIIYRQYKYITIYLSTTKYSQIILQNIPKLVVPILVPTVNI